MAEQVTTEQTSVEQGPTDVQLAALIEKPAETTQTTETTETKPTEPESKETTTTEASGEVTDASKEQPQPGTPDKVIQKMQQDLAASDRKLDALLAKVEAGGTLTAKEKEQATEAQRKIDSIKTALAGKNFDVLENGETLAQSLLETDESIQGLRKGQQQTQQTISSLQEQVAELKAEKVFSKLEKTYPGIDLQEVWKKCLGDATELLGADNPALGKVANKYFHERADAASKSVKARKGKETPTPTPSPTPTPGGAEVQVKTGTGTLTAPDESQEYVNRAMSLVKSDD